MIAAGIFAVPYIVLYSTIFTNGKGLASGLVGSLGYWLVQQGVERGSQPPFYYALIQIPIYEFLPALAGTFAALAAGVTWLSRMRLPESDVGGENESGVRSLLLVFLGYWAISTLLAYSFAGERMPWITVHITLPFILLAGWGVGAFLERLEWRKLRENRGWLVAGLLILLTISILRAITSLLGEIPPFQGYEIPQLNASVNFLAAVAVALGTSIALVRSAQGWSWTHVARLFGVIALVILTLVTIRTSARAAYVNYDEATEFLVYAHMARGPKTILEQVDDLSERLSNNPDFKIAYDNESTYPFWWYLRDNEKAIYFGANPSRDLLNYSVLIVGDANWSKLDPLVQDAFHTYDYMRIWWPNQDYFQWSRSSLESDRNNELRAEGVTEIPPMGVGEHLLRFWQKISPYILDPAHRNAAWEIWFNRDFTEYGELKGVDFSLTNWSPSSKMRLYVRKDVASRVWDYGVDQPEVEYADIVDPYEDELILLYPDQSIGGSGVETGSFVSPRGNAIAPDGSLYVADTMSHRIQHFDPDGEVLHVWGRFGSTDQGNADEGAFNEPWGIGVAPDGSVYVADTWNHRIQHFTADGEFLGMFGTFGQGETPYAFWGPRDVVVDSTGRVFVSDTGNKRVVIFDQQGEYLSEFGGFGLDMGFLDEPVGLALDELGRLYVADTWNQRIQVFEEAGNSVFRPIAEWPITAWFGQSLDNKPYLSVGRGSVVCTTDPEGPRVLCFDQEGEFLVGWGSSVDEGLFFGNLSGISFDDDCGVWVTDTGNGQIMHFSLDICQE
ncbi:MAG: hypothetical protein GTO14_03250 [Anaerolineales bacterium]|nr:hypothetical protein [Anaerolineales bacterium]